MATIQIKAPDHPSEPLTVSADLLPPELLAELRRRGFITDVPDPEPPKRKGSK